MARKNNRDRVSTEETDKMLSKLQKELVVYKPKVEQPKKGYQGKNYDPNYNKRKFDKKH